MTLENVKELLKHSPIVLDVLAGKQFKSVLAVNINEALGYFLMEELDGTIYYTERDWLNYTLFFIAAPPVTMKIAKFGIIEPGSIIVDVDLSASEAL